jgi:hypothetical protein
MLILSQFVEILERVENYILKITIGREANILIELNEK